MKIERIDIKYAKINRMVTQKSELCHTKILPWLSIVQSQEGVYGIQLGNRKAQATEEGGFFIAPSGIQQTITHHLNPQTQQMRCRWLFLDVVINKTYRPDFLYDFPTILPKEQTQAMQELFDRLFASNSIFENYRCYYEILEILFSLATPNNNGNHSAMQSTLEYIRKNFASEIKVEDLAKAAHMSASNLFAVFKKQFGVSPITYVNQYRLSLANEYLLEHNASITEIAAMVGFRDALYFSKMFRKMYQVSPKEYRKQHQEKEKKNHSD